MFSKIKNKVRLENIKDLLNDSEKLKKAKEKIINGKFTDENFPATIESILGFNENNHFS